MSDGVFRLKVGVNLSASGSMGDWSYFDTREALEIALIEAHVDVVMNGRNGHRSRIARIWRRMRGVGDYPNVSHIFAVEQYVGEGWTALPFSIIEPHVEWAAAS